MGDLVQNRVVLIFSFGAGRLLSAGDVGIIVSDQTHVFHGSVLVVRAENLVELSEWVSRAEDLLVVADTALCDAEPIVCDQSALLFEGLSNVQFHWNLRICVFRAWCEHSVRSSNHSVEVGADGDSSIKSENFVTLIFVL